MAKEYGAYTSDDGFITCAVLIDDDTFNVMGFSTPADGTPRQPRGLTLRKQGFVDPATGKRYQATYPLTTPPFPLGSTTTLRGVIVKAVGYVGERNHGEG